MQYDIHIRKIFNSHDVLNELISPKFKTNEADIGNKQLFSSLHKRKFEEIEKNKNEFQNSFSPKFPKISDSSYLKENCWEQYTNLKPYTIKSYSSLLPSKSFIPNVKDENDEADEGDIFTTAAGKSINISKKAMLAAEKLIQGVFQDDTNPKMSPVENKQFIKMPVVKKKRVTSCATRSHKDDIGCPPKKPLIENNDDTLDRALIEKFFEDPVFEERESQDIAELNKEKVLESDTNKDPKNTKQILQKKKKSLGGRRASMCFY